MLHHDCPDFSNVSREGTFLHVLRWLRQPSSPEAKWGEPAFISVYSTSPQKPGYVCDSRSIKSSLTLSVRERFGKGEGEVKGSVLKYLLLHNKVPQNLVA